MPNLFPDLKEKDKPVNTGGGNLFPDLAPKQERATNPDQPEQGGQSFAAGAGQQLLQGATLNTADEIQSVIAAAVAAPFISDKTFSQLMVDARKSFREQNKKFEEQNPKTALGLQLAGGLATGGAGLGATSTIKGAAAVGGTMGAIAGAGTSDQPEFLTKETAIDAGIGAVGGAAIGAAIPAAGKVVKPIAKDIAKIFTKQSPTKQRIAKLIESGSVDNETARFKLKEGVQPAETKLGEYLRVGAPKVEADNVAREAIKQGYDEGVIAAIKGASKTDKAKMLKMVEILDRGRKNQRFSVENRPSDVVGDTLLQRLKTVKSANQAAGQQLDIVAKSLKGQPFDAKEPVGKFVQDLHDMGITFSNKGGKIKANYKNSDIQGLKSIENLMTRVISRMSNVDKVDALAAHRMKRFLDQQVPYGKTKGLTGKARTVLKKLRHNLDKTLDDSYPKYNQVNTVYSDTINAIDSLQDVSGQKMDLSGKNADKAVGTLLRRLLSKQQSRVRLLDAVNEVESVAKKYSGDGKKLLTGKGNGEDDLLTQVMFADELESVFGSSAKTSFQGDIEKAINKGANLATSPTSGFDAGVSILGKGAEKIRGINPDNAIKAIKDLLSE